MLYLIFSILSSTSIFIIFKLIGKLRINTFNVIVINYIIASAVGFILYGSGLSIERIISAPWMVPAVIIGIVFIITFYTIGISSQKAGITITTVAAKMSVVFPILFSIIYYSEELGFIKATGIITALFAVILSVIRKSNTQADKKYLILPFILFIFLGIVDSIIKYSQEAYLTTGLSSLFTATLFTVSGITGILVAVANKRVIKGFSDIRIWYWGIILGISNFGSVFFLINALNKNIYDSSIIFGINNIGIVALSVLAGLLFFRERLTIINWSGICLAFIAIIMLMIS